MRSRDHDRTLSVKTIIMIRYDIFKLQVTQYAYYFMYNYDFWTLKS